MVEPEFEKTVQQKMEQCHVKPLWLAERSVNPAQPRPKTVPWPGSGRSSLTLFADHVGL